MEVLQSCPTAGAGDSQEDSTNLAVPLGATGISLTADWKVISGTLMMSHRVMSHRVRLTAH